MKLLKTVARCKEGITLTLTFTTHVIRPVYRADGLERARIYYDVDCSSWEDFVGRRNELLGAAEASKNMSVSAGGQDVLLGSLSMDLGLSSNDLGGCLAIFLPCEKPHSGGCWCSDAGHFDIFIDVLCALFDGKQTRRLLEDGVIQVTVTLK